MSYSIFQETMADMNYQQIEKAAEQKLPVLFPIAVIEEHGPHLCLGTDVYLTYQLCKCIKKALSDSGTESLIAPPFYWGINSITNGFAGSFTVKPETMISVLCDSLESLKKWGFEKIFLFNMHGDFVHNITILESVRKAYEESGVGAYFIEPSMPAFFLERAGISEEKSYLLSWSRNSSADIRAENPPEYMDVHAGSIETSIMMNYFKDMVDLETTRSLKSSMTTLEKLKIWEQQGGEQARAITPLGYLGNPSDINLNAVNEFKNEVVTITNRLLLFLNR